MKSENVQGVITLTNAVSENNTKILARSQLKRLRGIRGLEKKKRKTRNNISVLQIAKKNIGNIVHRFEKKKENVGECSCTIL